MPSNTRKITLKAIEGLSDGSFVWDSEIRGFGVRARGTGHYYVLKTRVKGQQRWFTICKHGATFTPNTARKKALSLLSEIVDGGDPAVVRADLKKRLTISELCDIYLKDRLFDQKASHTVNGYWAN